LGEAFADVIQPDEKLHDYDELAANRKRKRNIQKELSF
jgi:hypothetical protein